MLLLILAFDCFVKTLAAPLYATMAMLPELQTHAQLSPRSLAEAAPHASALAGMQTLIAAAAIRKEKK